MANLPAKLRDDQSPALPEAVESVLATGDLGKLNTQQRIAFYQARCQAAGLDPRSRPFEYIILNGKLTLYAKKECAEQLNGMHGLSHEIVSTEQGNGLYEVRVHVFTQSRSSEDVGVVVTEGLKGLDLANARMKAVTKAKRRATLSFCGLGDVIDETELDTVEHRPCTANGTPEAYDNKSGHATGQYASEEQTQSYLAAMRGYLENRNDQWLDRWQNKATGEIPGLQKDLVNEHQADNHLVKCCVESGRLDPAIKSESVQARNRGRFTAIVYHRGKDDRKWITQELARYCDEQERLHADRLRRICPELFEPLGREPGCDDDLSEDDAFDRLEGIK